jgi:tellurite resistance protein
MHAPHTGPSYIHGPRLDRLVVAAQLLASVSDVYTPTERLGFLQVRRSPSETEGWAQNTCMRSSVAASIGYWSWSTAVAGNDLARGPCL